jgi:Arc/MetJ-type ribon-helix-helix transcriptional regulator
MTCTDNKTITPSELRAQAQQLIKSGRMPSLSEVLKAVSETREKYRPLILAARAEKEVR